MLISSGGSTQLGRGCWINGPAFGVILQRKRVQLWRQPAGGVVARAFLQYLWEATQCSSKVPPERCQRSPDSAYKRSTVSRT
jgi:hypothetical protein